MGNNLNCTCVKSPDEPEIGVSTNVIDSNSNLMNVKASHKETAIENPKEEDKSQRFVKSLQDRISQETDKSVTVNEITRDKFETDEVQGLINNCLDDVEAMTKLSNIIFDLVDNIKTEDKVVAEQPSNIDNLLDEINTGAKAYGFK